MKKHINRHKMDLNQFLEEYDMYDGRILSIWELQEIFEYNVDEASFAVLCEENQIKSRLRNKTLELEFLWRSIVTFDGA